SRGAAGRADVALAEELARRAAIAVDNARLYREVAERAQAAQALAFVGDGIVLVDPLGIVRLWNAAAETITGLAAEQVVGVPATHAIPGWKALAARVTPADIPGETPPPPPPIFPVRRRRARCCRSASAAVTCGCRSWASGSTRAPSSRSAT